MNDIQKQCGFFLFTKLFQLQITIGKLQARDQLCFFCLKFFILQPLFLTQGFLGWNKYFRTLEGEIFK